MGRPQKFRHSREALNDPQIAEELGRFVLDIETLRQKRKQIDDQIAAAYDAVDDGGFEKKFVRKVVSLRAKETDKRRDEEEGLEVYEFAIEKGVSLACARSKPDLPPHNPETGEITEPDHTSKSMAARNGARKTGVTAGRDPRTEFQSEQPCTATGPSEEAGASSDETPATLSHAPVNVPRQAPADDVAPLASSAPLPENDLCADATLSGARQSHGPDPHELGAAIHEELKSGTPNQTNPLPNLSPSPEPVSSQVEADRAGEVVSSSTSPPTHSKTIRDYRPHCQHPECCGGSGLSHCHSCQKIADAAESVAA